jgi:adenylosuccinate synthase
LSEDTLEPVYKELSGWNLPLNNIESFDALPDPLSEYIRFIEKETGIPVDMVSIGPDRVQTLKR